jgi:hypothetical protein
MSVGLEQGLPNPNSWEKGEGKKGEKSITYILIT